jgi:hypothetical protein
VNSPASAMRTPSNLANAPKSAYTTATPPWT